MLPVEVFMIDKTNSVSLIIDKTSPYVLGVSQLIMNRTRVLSITKFPQWEYDFTVKIEKKLIKIWLAMPFDFN